MAYDTDLTPLLAQCTDEDLNTLVEYIKEKGGITENLTIHEDYKKYNPQHSKYMPVIVDEIQRFCGDTFANLVRGGGVPYMKIVKKVASKLHVEYNDDMSIREIEQNIIAKIIKDAWEKMDEKERIAILEEANVDINNLDEESKKIFINGNFSAFTGAGASMAFIQLLINLTGFQAYQMSVIVANLVARTILGHGLALGTNAAITRGLAVFAGPVGWVISGLLMAPLVSGPAYRVIVPCVIHIAMLREKYSK